MIVVHHHQAAGLLSAHGLERLARRGGEEPLGGGALRRVGAEYPDEDPPHPADEVARHEAEDPQRYQQQTKTRADRAGYAGGPPQVVSPTPKHRAEHSSAVER